MLFRHLWRWVWCVGVRPRRVRPFLPYPGSGCGRPASVRSFPILAVLTTHTLPTIIACANVTALPFPAPLPTYLILPAAPPLTLRRVSSRSLRSFCSFTALPVHLLFGLPLFTFMLSFSCVSASLPMPSSSPCRTSSPLRFAPHALSVAPPSSSSSLPARVPRAAPRLPSIIVSAAGANVLAAVGRMLPPACL